MNTITLESKQLTFWGDMLGATVVILLSGKSGVGKTTSAGFIKDIVENNNLTAVVSSFAGGVKSTAYRCFDWDGDKDNKGRKLLQNIGNTGREYDENMWVNKMINDIETVVEANGFFMPDIVIVDDWRFPNEHARFEQLMYETVTIRIESPEKESLKGTEEYNDISEISLDDYNFDFSIMNDGSLEDLNYVLERIIMNLIRKEK